MKAILTLVIVSAASLSFGATKIPVGNYVPCGDTSGSMIVQIGEATAGYIMKASSSCTANVNGPYSIEGQTFTSGPTVATSVGDCPVHFESHEATSSQIQFTTVGFTLSDSSGVYCYQKLN